MKNKIEDNPTTRTDYRRRRNRASYLSVLLFVLCHVSTAIWLAACTDDIAPADEPVAGSPVELTARVAGHVQSRATTDNTWNGGEEVGVQLDGVCYKYIADAAGKLTPASGQEVPRWSGPNDQKTVIAWYPYSDELPTTFAVMKSQNSSIENYYKSDFLLAKETRISIGNPEITFRHLPAKVVVNLKAGDGVTNEDLLGDVPVDIHFWHKLISGEKLISGTINPAKGTVEFPLTQTGKDSLYANALPQAAPGYIKSYQALIMPYKLTRDAPFIKVRSVQTDWFYYTPQSEDELMLEAGKKYVYNITVMKDGLQVVHYEKDADWVTEEQNMSRKETEKGYRAQDVKPFDYYYSDGTYSDGGYRRYTDGTKAWMDIAPTEGKQVIGIVFQTDPKRISSAEAKKGFQAYAVAVTDCGDIPYIYNRTYPWGVLGTDIPGITAPSSFTECMNLISGYEATQAVIKEIGNGNAEGLKDTGYKAFYEVCQYGQTDYTKQYAAPAGSSGWYLPSIGQWWDIAKNLFDCEFSEGGIYGWQQQDYVRKHIATQLKWIPGAEDFVNEYWTSSVYDVDYAWNVVFDKGNTTDKRSTISLQNGRKRYERHVRAVIAFSVGKQ